MEDQATTLLGTAASDANVASRISEWSRTRKGEQAPPEEVEDQPEDEVDLSEDEDFSDEPDEEGDDEPSEDDAKPFVPFAIEVDGETIEFGSPEDVKAAALRHSDYTRKTQALASERQQWESSKAEVEQRIYQQAQYYHDRLAEVENTLSGTTEPDWAALESDPAVTPKDILAIQKAWREHQSSLSAIQQERMRVAQETQRRTQQEQAAYAKQQQELLFSAKPEWQNEKVRNQDFASIQRYMTDLGFTGQEIGGVRDHRFFQVLDDARRYQELQQNAPQPKKRRGPKGAAPGSGSDVPNRKNRRSQQVRERARQTGNVRDVGAAIAATLRKN